LAKQQGAYQSLPAGERHCRFPGSLFPTDQAQALPETQSNKIVSSFSSLSSGGFLHQEESQATAQQHDSQTSEQANARRTWSCAFIRLCR
jgi:hypothetical protein